MEYEGVVTDDGSQCSHRQLMCLDKTIDRLTNADEKGPQEACVAPVSPRWDW